MMKGNAETGQHGCTAPSDATQSPLAVEAIRVRADRIELTVRIASLRYAKTDSDLIAACLQRTPSLALHTCRNEKGPTFGDVMYSTSVPHLLEHLVVDAQTRLSTDSSRIFVGTTEWDVERNEQSDGPLFAKIALSYEDDVVALAAIKNSAEFLNDTLRAQRGHES